MMQSKIRLATVFSGIGAIEQALIKMNIPNEIVFACDNGERILNKTVEEITSSYDETSSASLNEFVKSLYSKPNWMKTTYFANYDIQERNWYEDIRFLDGKPFHNKVDLFVGGSPCQSFSNMGKRKGLEDARGTLFYEFARLVKEMQPKVFIYENVPGMLNHDNGNTWSVISSIFEELDYKIYSKILNAKDYGIPQNRNRLFVVGFKNKRTVFTFPEAIKSEKKAKDFLEKNNNVPAKYYLKEKGFKFVTTKTSRAKINQDIIRTQKANQQFNWNGDFVFVKKDEIKNSEILNRAYLGNYNGAEGYARLMTPRECLRLMGFSDNFKIVVPDYHMYRQSGNSIVVNVLENIVKEILNTGVFDEED